MMLVIKEVSVHMYCTLLCARNCAEYSTCILI